MKPRMEGETAEYDLRQDELYKGELMIMIMIMLIMIMMNNAYSQEIALKCV